ncbi:hypothetical protein PhaeoP14_02623 [Phaeobacter piscinae]|nr:hypothetical protein PhaeoP14_02623 [Phaeobacter piscinae]
MVPMFGLPARPGRCPGTPPAGGACAAGTPARRAARRTFRTLLATSAPGRGRSALLPQTPACSQGPFATPLHPLALARSAVSPEAKTGTLNGASPSWIPAVAKIHKRSTKRFTPTITNGSSAQIVTFAKSCKAHLVVALNLVERRGAASALQPFVDRAAFPKVEQPHSRAKRAFAGAQPMAASVVVMDDASANLLQCRVEWHDYSPTSDRTQ